MRRLRSGWLVGGLLALCVMRMLSAAPLGPQTSESLRKEVPNFTLVQTVGCLTENPARTWTLTQATDIVATKDVPATPTELKDAEATRPGSLRFQLVSVLPFKPDAHRGQRVLLKGLINRYPGEEPLLNVIALHVVSPSGC
jgi:hypothetical protein